MFCVILSGAPYEYISAQYKLYLEMLAAVHKTA